MASKDPVLCFDQRHQHALGGGSYWANGYNKLLSTLRHNIGSDYPLVSGNVKSFLSNIFPFYVTLIFTLVVNFAVVTNCFFVESNGEVYIENVLGFLSLGGYELCVMVTIKTNLKKVCDKQDTFSSAKS